ncbi:MAG TPA: glycosyltransferase [Kofleriaceae bacterium]|nr:glycosyltransferase [Kofleriaceae bacterium]
MARGPLKGIAALVGAAVRDPKRLLRWASSAVTEARTGGAEAVRRKLSSGTGAYQQWIARYDTIEESDRAAIERRLATLTRTPTFSILMPVYNVDETWLREAIDSVLDQIYPHWELCLVDDASSEPHVRGVLDDYAARDARVRVAFRTDNGHISAASNTALALATGEFIALLDHDDLLAPHALFMVALELEEHPDADLLYSDEDGIDEAGERFKPMFKPDFAPELLLSVNCISHLGVYRTSIVREAGGFRVGFEGSQDLDLALRVVERSAAERIRHIPHVLYHWRAIPGSVQTGGGAKEYAHDAARRAIAEHLARRGETANVTQGFRRLHRVTVELPVPAPLVTLVIVAAADSAALERTLVSLAESTGYDPFEIIVVTSAGASMGAASASATRSISAVVGTRASAVDAARGTVVVFVRAGLVAREPFWLHDLVAHALRDGVGAVGGRIVEADGAIVAAGLAIGADGEALELYRGARSDEPGQLYRAQVLGNYTACSAALLAARRAGLAEAGVPDRLSDDDVAAGAAICARLRARGRRIVWTPHSELVATAVAERATSRAKPAAFVDPMLSPNLAPSGTGVVLASPPGVAKPWR